MDTKILNYPDSPTLTRKRKTILKAAKELFIKNGIESTTMTDIAVAADMTRRSLYNYYPAKDQIAIDIQILNLESINWFDNWNELNAENFKPRFMEIVTKALTTEYIENLYIYRFDTYFCCGYPDERYTTYLKSKTSLPLYLDGSQEIGQTRKEMVLIFNLVIAYIQRLVIRKRSADNGIDDFAGELEAFSIIISKTIELR